MHKLLCRARERLADDGYAGHGVFARGKGGGSDSFAEAGLSVAEVLDTA
jgi:hypothetical protein